ncbi:aquaporin family protein [Cryobacterium sp. TMN-39-2]|uniref:Aquaporin family protein n=2 Tax=Microbacteriaceae TaxID=85023 RepID=A0A2S3Z7U4_9MICO|nr:aquaporin family protein [Cryobacterium zongtaii]POH65418.1 aquaporin family protein [Cryobacterium zongtaii]POH67335.1 aquaporin family protein [Cryobacterium zongtaii]TFC45117.1 aquaporin family protein [Cryobacterium sp. TMN-39-2]
MVTAKSLTAKGLLRYCRHLATTRKVIVDNIGLVFLSEVLGTGMLTLLGCGVVANVALTKNKGFGGGFLMVTIGWAFAVFVGVVVAYNSGGHLNPAVTLGIVASGSDTFGGAADVPVNFLSTLVYLAGEFLGAFLGAVVVWLAYKQHYDEEPEPANKLGTFSTGPAIRSYGWNLVTEIIGTFVLVFVVFAFGGWGQSGDVGAVAALPVALLVLVIGVSLGGPTGYAINPARDLGPRIAHFILPIKGKGSSDWAYSWVPVVGPVIGGVLAGWASLVWLPMV